MYLNLHSFNARTANENRYINIVTFETEEYAKRVLDAIKEYNIGRDVIYTCAKCEVSEDLAPRYGNMMWKFGYLTMEEPEDVVAIVKGICGECSEEKPIEIEGATCPFMEA